MKGWAELCLLAMVLASCWTRTPVGAAVTGAVALVQGKPTPDLLASFRTAVPAQLQRSLARAVQVRAGGTPPSVGGTRGRSSLQGELAALRLAVATGPGDDALQAVFPSTTPRDAAPAPVDVAQAAAALEIWSVGGDVRDRAIARARAAGQEDPERFESHRRFLPGPAAARADRDVGETLALATVLDLTWPVDPDTRISSGFGYRTHPTLGTRKLHEGVDLAVPAGTDVSAAGFGKVVRARFDKLNGNYVKLKHGHGVTTAYCHAQTLFVHKGDRVARGQVILASGSTGRSTGPHLHFGLRINGHAVDPAPFRLQVQGTATR